MDHILESEVLVVVLQAPGGLTFGEFRRHFHCTHGYPLDLARYGYSSLQRLLDDMKELVAVVEVADEEPQIACRSLHRHKYVFLGNIELSPKGGLYSAQVLENSSTSNRPSDVPGIHVASELLANSLSAFATGLKLRKLKEVVKKEHGTDLEELSRSLGCTDAVDLLQKLPNIKLLNPSKPSNCVVQLQGGLGEMSLSSSQCSLASGFQTPSSDVFMTEEEDTKLEELGKDWSVQATQDYLQQPNIQCMERAKPSHYVVHHQNDLGGMSLSSSQCSLNSGFQTPSSDLFLMEENDTKLKELGKDWSVQATQDYLQQPNIQCMERAKPSHYVVHHQNGIQKASELLANTLSAFATGLKLRKLKEVVKKEHGTDLEELSRSLGCTGVLDLLQQLPNIRLLNPSKPSNCVVQLQGGLGKMSLSSSQCSLASGFQTPSSDVFLTEEKDTKLEELGKDWSVQATQDDLQQPNIQCMESAKPSHDVAHHQEGLGEMSLSSSQCSLASGFQTPSSDVFFTEEKDTKLEELGKDWSVQATQDDLQQPNIQCMESSKPSHYVTHHQEGITKASELLANTLSAFATGLKLRKLKEVVKKEHGTDLEELSRSLGCAGVLDLLQQLPNIRLLNPSKPSNCVVQLQGDLCEVPVTLSCSQCRPASGVHTPGSEVVLLEKGDTNLEELSKHWSDQATVDVPQQQPNIQSKGMAKPSIRVERLQEDSKPPDGFMKLNHEISRLVPPSSHSASTKPKSMPLTSRPLLRSSSAIPVPIHPQNNIHIQDTPKQSFTKCSSSTNQAKSKAKKNPLQTQNPPLKQSAVDELCRPLATHPHHQHQEKSYTPQVSKHRTATLSYSSVVSRNVSEASVNKPPINKPPAPSSTSIHYIDASSTQHSAHHFSPPISDFPHLSEKTLIGSQCFRTMETDHYLTMPKNAEELKNNILCVLEAHPKGMSLFQFQNTYRRLFHHMLPLNGYTSVKQMLEEMKEVIRMEDHGIQYWVFPVSSHAISTQVMDQEFGLQNQPVNEQPSHTIDATMSTTDQLTQKPQNESQHKSVTSKALLHNSAKNPSKPRCQRGLVNTCGPEHPVGNAALWSQRSSSQLNQPLVKETLKHIPVPELLANEFPPLQRVYTTNNAAERLPTNKNIHMQDTPIALPNVKTQTAPFMYSNIVSGNNQAGLSSNSISANLPATTSFSNEQLITSLSTRSDNHSWSQLSVPKSDCHNLLTGDQDELGYRQTTGHFSDARPEVPNCDEELKTNIFQVLIQYPDGMSIFQFQKRYRFMFGHMLPLNGSSSVKQLLMTMPDVVKTRGLGVQMVVFPFSSDIPCCQLIMEENGFSLSEMETVPYPTEQDAAYRNTTSSAKMPLSLNSSLSAKKKAVHALSSTSSESLASFQPRCYTLDPEATVFSPSSTICFPQFPSVEHNGVSTSFSEDISGDNCHTPSRPNFPAQCHTLISDCPTSIADSFDDPSTSLLLTPPSSSFRSLSTNSGAHPSSVVDFEQSAAPSEYQNGLVSSEELLSNDYMNQQARTCSQAATCDDKGLLTPSQTLFVPGTDQKKGTGRSPKKTSRQNSRTNGPVQFVGPFIDLQSANDYKPEILFYGSTSEKPNFETEAFFTPQ